MRLVSAHSHFTDGKKQGTEHRSLAQNIQEVDAIPVLSWVILLRADDCRAFLCARQRVMKAGEQTIHSAGQQCQRKDTDKQGVGTPQDCVSGGDGGGSLAAHS
jgi:hypothetical protein